MGEIIYGLNSFVIACTLFVSMAVVIEAGYRFGRARAGTAGEAPRTHIHAILASLLGVLALLLGFTFSLALQRYDSRSQSVVDEANAIGTTYLRAQLWPVSVRGDIQKLLQSYLNIRVEAGSITIDRHDAINEHLLRANEQLDALWSKARVAAEEDPNPATTGLFIQSLNEAIDSYGRREAALSRHVPEVISFLLFVTLLISGGTIGYAAGVASQRPALATYSLIAIIIMVVFIIIDLDRPRRGLIRVDQSSLVQLRTAIDAAQAAGNQATVPAQLPRPAVTGRR